MPNREIRRVRDSWIPALNLLLVLAGFGVTAVFSLTHLRESAAMLLWDDLVPAVFSLLITSLATWLGLWFTDFPQRRNDDLAGILQQVSGGLGLAFLVQALLGYAQFSVRLPFSVMMTGALATGILLTLAGLLLYPRLLPPDPSAVFLGYDRVTDAILRARQVPVLGVLTLDGESVPESTGGLGDAASLPEIVAAGRPGEIVLGTLDWTRFASPSTLLQHRLAGISILEASSLYESVLRRVCTARLRPSDFFFTAELDAPRRNLAFQSIYSNVLGLAMLAVAMPVILLCAVLIKLFGGPGPALERIECAGFKEIPFRLLRFRTHREDNGHYPTRIGRLLLTLRLAKLPELINVVRGEMVLIGPDPVRVDYAHRMAKLIPFYQHRFSVKPGLTGWARLHRQRRETVRVMAELEYDLYYVKNVSPLFDLEILLGAATQFS